MQYGSNKTWHILFSAVFPACLREWGADSALGCSKGRPAATHCWGETSTPFHHNLDFLHITRRPIVLNRGTNLIKLMCVVFLRFCVSQLRELEDKYAECMEMLHEAQEELKNLRNKTLPLNTPRRFHSLGLFPMVSRLRKHHLSVAYIVPVATENLFTFWCSPPGLSGSRNRGHHEEGASDGWPRRRRAEVPLKRQVGWFKQHLNRDVVMINVVFLSNFSRLQPKRVFQTVKNLNLMRQQRSSLAPSPLNIPGSNQTSCFTSGRSSRVGTPRCNSIFSSETGSGIILDNRTSSTLETPDNG